MVSAVKIVKHQVPSTEEGVQISEKRYFPSPRFSPMPSQREDRARWFLKTSHSHVLWSYDSMSQEYLRVRKNCLTFSLQFSSRNYFRDSQFFMAVSYIFIPGFLGRIESSHIWRLRLGLTSKKAWVFHLTSLSFNLFYDTTLPEVLYVDANLGVAEWIHSPEELKF